MEPAGPPGQRQRLRVAEVLRASLELYRSQAPALWITVALIAIPAQVLVWIMVRVSLSGHARAVNGTILAGNSAALPTVAITLLGFLSAILAVGALTWLLIETYTGARPRWQESLGYASERFLPLGTLGLISIVLLSIGYTLFIVPGLFLTVAWSISVPVLLVERVSPTRALSRSWELVRGDWWVTFGALLVALLMIVGISLLVGEILGSAASSAGIDVILALAGISRALGAILTYPLLAAVMVVLYAHLRIGKEGVSPDQLIRGPMPSR